MPGPVGRVQIYQQIRIPALNHVSEERLRLICLDNHAVPIQIISVRCPHPGHDRTQFLIGPRILPHGVIAVGIIDRHKNQYLIVQQMLLVSEQNIAHHNQRGFLTLHFATMNVCLNSNHRFAAGFSLRRRGDWRICQHNDGHVTSFPGQQQGFAVHQVSLAVQRIQHLNNLIERGGTLVMTALGRSHHAFSERRDCLRLRRMQTHAGADCERGKCVMILNPVRAFHRL